MFVGKRRVSLEVNSVAVFPDTCSLKAHDSEEVEEVVRLFSLGTTRISSPS